MREYIVQYERKETDNPNDKCDLCNHAIVGELVRCKDCRFYSNDHLCEQLSRFGSIEPLADFYCAFGERREP